MSEIVLTDQATQTGLAAMLNVSQQTVSKQYKKGILSPNGTYIDWLREYTEHLRNEAAGRGGDSQQVLTRARIDETLENTAVKRQQRLRDAGTLLDKDDTILLVAELAGQLRGHVMTAGDEIVEELISRYKLELDDDIILKPLRSALGHCATDVREFAGRSGSDGIELGADAAASGS
ncbi:hypothetical protein [Bermanella sp. R86510]|jgi:hypothetical protein|uniref:hypothetical protein n=1 Tax=unclassified Bermanella TaxID=2627862 RepID=UPI0037C55066